MGTGITVIRFTRADVVLLLVRFHALIVLVLRVKLVVVLGLVDPRMRVRHDWQKRWHWNKMCETMRAKGLESKSFNVVLR